MAPAATCPAGTTDVGDDGRAGGVDRAGLRLRHVRQPAPALPAHRAHVAGFIPADLPVRRRLSRAAAVVVAARQRQRRADDGASAVREWRIVLSPALAPAAVAAAG